MHQTHPNRMSVTGEKGVFPDARAQIILTAIINEHFVTGEPVGSKVLATRFGGTHGMSSATIRNVMGAHEELRFVQPTHTSAGRTPSDKGYRFFLDNLLGDLRISYKALPRIGKEYRLNAQD